MTARTQFKIGLLLLNLGVLLTGWTTWCKKGNVIYSSKLRGWDRFWDEQMAFLDGRNLGITVVTALLVTAGIFCCVDAVVWRPRTVAVKPNQPLQRTGSAGR